jgi:hypothetical protein
MNKCLSAAMATTPAPASSRLAGSSMRPTPIRKSTSARSPATSAGNWLYGGSNNQIVLQATQIQDSRNAGYNLAYGIAEMSLSIGN